MVNKCLACFAVHISESLSNYFIEVFILVLHEHLQPVSFNISLCIAEYLLYRVEVGRIWAVVHGNEPVELHLLL